VKGEFEDGIGEHARHFLRHVVADARHDAVRARAGEAGGMHRGLGRVAHAVVGAVEGDGGYGDGGTVTGL